jgi:hypothetical protein
MFPCFPLCKDICAHYPQDTVFIGGIAVYLHAVGNAPSQYAETTHDADFCISLVAMSSLRDEEELVASPRPKKYQLTKQGFEFDIYPERQSGLVVPYDAISAYRVMDALRAKGIPQDVLDEARALILSPVGVKGGSARCSMCAAAPAPMSPSGVFMPPPPPSCDRAPAPPCPSSVRPIRWGAPGLRSSSR